MVKVFQRKGDKLGTAPGTLQFIGIDRKVPTQIRLVQFNKEEVRIWEDLSPETLSDHTQPDRVNWVIVRGLQDTEQVVRVGRQFGMHELSMEDLLDTTQNPKFEDIQDHFLLIAKRLHKKNLEKRLEAEQLSLVVGKNYVLLFQETDHGLFNSIIKRIENGESRVRKKGSLYLGYALLDRLVDSYFRLLEESGQGVEELEDALLDDLDKETLNRINEYKREINFMGRHIRPLKDIVFQYSRSELGVRNKEMVPFFRDLRDHLNQTLETLQIFKEMLENQMHTYNALVANKMNDIMRVLTIFSVIFIPMSFLAAVYGMNFEFFPELSLRYGYLLFWLIQLVIGVVMLYYFRRKRWI